MSVSSMRAFFCDSVAKKGSHDTVYRVDPKAYDYGPGRLSIAERLKILAEFIREKAAPAETGVRETCLPAPGTTVPPPMENVLFSVRRRRSSPCGNSRQIVSRG